MPPPGNAVDDVSQTPRIDFMLEFDCFRRGAAAMTDKPQFEIPDAVREMAERNVEQARQAYAQLMEAARQTQEMAGKSSDAMSESARDLQMKALHFAEENVNTTLSYATELAQARSLEDFLAIQTRYAQRQAANYASQAQELGRALTGVAQKPWRP
jgi:phasin